MDYGYNFTRVTGSSRIYQGPCLFGGLIVLASAAAKPVTVYDGIDDTTGIELHAFTTHDADSDPFLLPAPINIARGLYVVLDAAVSECLVLWIPLPTPDIRATMYAQAQAG